MNGIIQDYLLNQVKKLKETLPIKHILMQMKQTKSYMNVDQVAKQSCIRVRQLERQIMNMQTKCM